MQKRKKYKNNGKDRGPHGPPRTTHRRPQPSDGKFFDISYWLEVSQATKCEAGESQHAEPDPVRADLPVVDPDPVVETGGQAEAGVDNLEALEARHRAAHGQPDPPVMTVTQAVLLLRRLLAYGPLPRIECRAVMLAAGAVEPVIHAAADMAPVREQVNSANWRVMWALPPKPRQPKLLDMPYQRRR